MRFSEFIPDRILKAYDGDEKAAAKAIAQQQSIWTCGYDLTGEKKGQIRMADAIALPNASVLIPHVLTKVMRTGIEPMLVGARLLTEIPYQPGLQIQYPAVGALEAEDVAPGQSLPEIEPSIGGHVTHELRIAKSGLALKIFDDIVKYSAYNLVSEWVREAGRALARHKEKKIFNYINSVGTIVFDNSDRTLGISGKYTSGRKADGTLNGTMTMDDLLEMYAFAVNQGFIPDTILVHPLTWLMWLRDPVLRTFQLQYGGGAWFNMWQGDARNRDDLAAFPPYGEGQGQFVNPPGFAANPDGPETATSVEEYDQRLSSRPTLPSYLGLAFNFIISPFVPFDVEKNTATVIMFNANNLGALIVDERPKMQEWKRPELDLTYMQIYEKYAIAIANEGQGVVVARGIKVDRNYVADESVTPSLSISGSLVDPAASGVTSPIA